MLQIKVSPVEMWDESREEFVSGQEEVTLTLEHSLVSISKWEAKWHKPFLSKQDKTSEETLDYIRCMNLTPNVDPDIYKRLSKENIDDINAYIGDSMTATTFSDNKNGKRNTEIITSEIIYYWISSLNLSLECENWHLNRLITLIRVCSIKNQPPKNMSKSSIMKQNAALNAARRKKYNTKG